MFECKDKNGKQIHTDDEVKDSQGRDCIVTCIFEPTEIQINPLGDGLPELVHPETVEVINSFIEKLNKLTTDEELQAILSAAESRLAAEMAERKTTKKTNTEGPRKVKTVTENVEEDL